MAQFRLDKFQVLVVLLRKKKAHNPSIYSQATLTSKIEIIKEKLIVFEMFYFPL